MQALQVVQRGGRGGVNVAAFIVPPVLLQAVVFPRAGHELPNARSARARIGCRIERAFNDRQQCDFHRHAAFLDLEHDVVQIAAAAIDDAR